MDSNQGINGLFEQNNGRKKVFKWLSGVIVILGVFLIADILFPREFAIVLNVLWIVLLAIVIVFFTLGVLVMLGMKKEVGRILDILLEGTLTIIDLIEFLKLAYRTFIQLLKDFLMFAAPIFAYILTAVLYILLLLLYKSVGKIYDVTGLTIGITVFLVFALGLINKPKQLQAELIGWSSIFKKSFGMAFSDAFEILLLLFFLTMDSTKLFFLPPELNIPIKAMFGNYDLMTRSFVFTDHLSITITLTIIAITTEIIRNALRVIAVAVKYYRSGIYAIGLEEQFKRADLLKSSVRKGFNDAKDDLVKFITFTTVLFFIFLIFPRLKLLAMVVASITTLAVDLIIPQRLTVTKGTDLLSRILNKVFNI